MSLFQISPLLIPARRVDRPIGADFSPHDLPRVIQHFCGSVRGVAQEGLVLDESRESCVVEQALHGQFLIRPDALHGAGVLQPAEDVRV